MFKELTPQVITIAERAGAAIMEIYQLSDVDVTHKSDQSPLTLADSTASKIIEDGLQKTTPDWPIISEESSICDYQERKEWNFFWLVDPLDGTKEFLNKNGEFTVNIALIENGLPILGVVYAPALDLFYFGGPNLGAYKLENGQQSEIVSNFNLVSPYKISVSRSHMDIETETLLEKLQPHTITPMGSSLKICLVAEGRSDLYPRLGPTMEWDLAAAHAILMGAEGDIYNLKGERFIYNKEDLKNERFFASSKHQQQHFLGLLKKQVIHGAQI